jgi:branched-chain amino acid transport system substrate-binding protein
LKGSLAIAVPWHRSPYSDFYQQAQDFWKASINWRTATTYDATQAIIQALSESRENFSRRQLHQKLSSPNFVTQGAEGKTYFDEYGDFQSTENVLVEVQESGKENYIFEKIE